MKRQIRSNNDLHIFHPGYKVIFENDLFTFRRYRGIGVQDTPYSALEVISKGIAKKHVVEVRLNSMGYQPFDGTFVSRTYKDAYVAHGMRMVSDTLEDTEEFIDALEAAVAFARRINEWLPANFDGEDPEYAPGEELIIE